MQQKVGVYDPVSKCIPMAAVSWSTFLCCTAGSARYVDAGGFPPDRRRHVDLKLGRHRLGQSGLPDTAGMTAKSSVKMGSTVEGSRRVRPDGNKTPELTVLRIVRWSQALSERLPLKFSRCQ